MRAQNAAMRTRAGFRASCLAAALAVLLAGCGIGADEYFYRPSRVGVGLPALKGEPVYVGLGALEARSGDTVRFELLEPIGATGFTQIEALVRPVSDAVNGELVGAMTEGLIAESWGIGPEAFTPLAGYEFDAADGPIEVVVRVNGEAPIARFDTLVLQFRVNGTQTRTQDLKFAGAACFAATLPEADANCDGVLD
jgi:hypothetical protein